jgi:FMN phosphatase YigB (HAD superfamily)
MNASNPEQVMHVGDDENYDAKMAQKVGMTPILFDPRHENAEEDFIIIHDLSEVLHYINK